VGADLSFVLTAQEAALPIKCYGPELMVMPIYSIEKFQEIKNERERKDAVDKCIEKVAFSLFLLFFFMLWLVNVT
jgi:NAD(P)H-hydrate repair Nnr-like enzyme with NAD(P)H-hydrate dehydratase domain